MWGAPRIHGELLKLGLDISQATVARYMTTRSRRPPSQTWRTFLANVFKEAGLKQLMTRYCLYHERWRTHLALDKDTPIPRPVMPPSEGRVVATPEVGGLHHRYERRAA